MRGRDEEGLARAPHDKAAAAARGDNACWQRLENQGFVLLQREASGPKATPNGTGSGHLGPSLALRRRGHCGDTREYDRSLPPLTRCPIVALLQSPSGANPVLAQLGRLCRSVDPVEASDVFTQDLPF